MTSDCATCRAALPWYAAAPESLPERAFVAAHLATCAECRAELVVWQAITRAVQTPRPTDTPPVESLSRTIQAVIPKIIPTNNHANSNYYQGGSRTMSDTSIQPIAMKPRTRRLVPALAVAAAIIIITALVFNTLRPVRINTGPPATIFPPLPHNIDWRSVSFGSPADGWAVGNTPFPDLGTDNALPPQPRLAHYRNGHWVLVAEPTTTLKVPLILESVAMVSPNEGWAISRNYLPPNTDGWLASFFWHFTNGQWHIITNQIDGYLRQVMMRTAFDGWAIGDNTTLGTGSEGMVYHYDGTAWRHLHDPAFANLAFSSITATSAQNVWLAGMDEHVTGLDGSGPNYLVRVTSQGWQRIANTTQVTVVALAAIGHNQVWGAGLIQGGTTPSGGANLNQPDQAAVVALNDSHWQTPQTYAPPAGTYFYALNALVLMDAQDGWAVGTNGLIAQLVNGHWQRAPSPTTEFLLGMTMVSPTEGWAVGTQGIILHLVNGAWRVVD